MKAEPESPDIVGVAPEDHPGSYQPYIPASARLPELRPVPIILGTILGMVFGASSLYLVLKVGLTVSASIPVAVDFQEALGAPMVISGIEQADAAIHSPNEHLQVDQYHRGIEALIRFICLFGGEPAQQ